MLQFGNYDRAGLSAILASSLVNIIRNDAKHGDSNTLTSRASLGFRVHSGWTAAVAVAVVKGVPLVLSRQRLHLVETFTYTFRQPYHTAREMSPNEGRHFISNVRAEARRLSLRAIRDLQADLQAQGYNLVRCGLLRASGRPLPRLPQILASHSLVHAADGELFRETLLHAAGRCGLEIYTVKERELLAEALRAIRLKSADLARRISDLGRSLGPPWSQDEKFASLAAWLALVSKAHG